MLLLVTGTTLAGCVLGVSGNVTAPASNPPLIVTATSGTLTQSTQITLNVMQQSQLGAFRVTLLNFLIKGRVARRGRNQWLNEDYSHRMQASEVIVLTASRVAIALLALT